MLKTVDLIKDIEEQYVPMLKMVNIPDFTKCIAQFSGLGLAEVPDDMIKEYLHIWARNKYRFFKLFGDKLIVDTPFSYKRLRDDIKDEVKNISKEFPVYSYWLEEFTGQTSNKVNNLYDFNWSFRNKLDDYFPQYKIVGSTITHFFKKCLNAPDELITQVAAIFENQTVEATHTMSIDPVDMMLASENPYDWTSCYRLETPNESSHADGCLASVLDDKIVINYVWNREGKFDLYNTYKFKNVRYKRMRQWMAISEHFTTIHFNSIYPGKDYEQDFEKKMRDIVESHIANYLGKENMWKKSEDHADCEREFGYGYSEFSDFNLWTMKGEDPESITVFNVQIKCPCGCGNLLPGSYDCDEEDYNGEGFICENYNDRYWCELADGYCEYGCSDCEDCENIDCWAWNNAHPVCDLDTDHYCEDPDNYYIDDGVMSSCKGHCSECPFYQEHHKDNDDEDEDSTESSSQITEPTGTEVRLNTLVTDNELLSINTRVSAEDIADRWREYLRVAPTRENTITTVNWQADSAPLYATIDEHQWNQLVSSQQDTLAYRVAEMYNRDVQGVWVGHDTPDESEDKKDEDEED